MVSNCTLRNVRKHAPNENPNKPAHPRSLIRVFVGNVKKLCTLTIQNAPSEDSDQTAKTQADLNLRGVIMSKGTFSDVAARVFNSSHQQTTH